MAKAMRRSVAGDRVGSLMDWLSASLLTDEEDCRQNMEALFLGAVPNVGAMLGEALDGKGIDAAVDRIMGKAGQIVLDTEGPFRVLVNEAVGRGLESIREELALCEETLGKRYEGLSSEACDAVDDAQGQLVTLAMVQYRANSGTVLVWVREQLRLELRVALSYDEPLPLIVGRLVSGVPVKAPQHTGRGLWWKVLEHCNRITREIEFATVNAARTEAMMQFNKIGEERR